MAAKKKAKRAAKSRTMRTQNPAKLGNAKVKRRRGPRTKWSEDQFLELLEENGDVQATCKALGIGRRTVYDYRDRHDDFAQRWDEVCEGWVDGVDGTVMRLARDGWNEPVFYQGKACGVVRKFSPMLMRFVLESRRPELYNLRWRYTKLLQEGGAGDGTDLAKFVVQTARAIDSMMPGGDGDSYPTDDTETSG